MQLPNLAGLLLDELLHGLPQILLQLYLLLLKLVFDLAGARLMLLDALLHPRLSLSHLTLHRVDLRILSLHFALQSRHICLQLLDLRLQRLDFRLKSLLGLLERLDLSVVLLSQLLDGQSV